MGPALDDRGPEFDVRLVHLTGLANVDLQVLPDERKQRRREVDLGPRRARVKTTVFTKAQNHLTKMQRAECPNILVFMQKQGANLTAKFHCIVTTLICNNAH